MGEHKPSPSNAWLAAVCAVAALLASSLWPTGVSAYDSLFSQMRFDAKLAQRFPDGLVETSIEDGVLVGTASERVRHLPDGRLSIERRRRYTAVRHPDTHALGRLPEPWNAVSNLVLEPNLRLRSVETRVDFKRQSGDAVFADYKLSDEQAWLFEADHSTMRATDHGRRLQMQVFLHGKLVKQQEFDYPADCAPFDIVPLYMSAALLHGISRFDLQVLFAGDGTHGVSVQVHRTRDLVPYAKGYRVPKARLHTAEPVAVMDMGLASPFKSLFFPHHYYMVFSIAHPEQLLMMWGGKSDSLMLAFRRWRP